MDVIDIGTAIGTSSKTVTEGYLYQGNLYKDAQHTQLINPAKDKLYIDLSNGTGSLYFYNGSNYIGVSGGVTTDKFLSGWDCTTGQPISFPHSTPYTYSTGMHFKVGAVAASGGTNYKPNGSSYTGEASTTVETGKVLVGDFYFYDGTSWIMLINTEHIRDVKVANASVVDANGDANIPKSDSSNFGVVKTWQGTQAQYDAIATKDADTYYFITE